MTDTDDVNWTAVGYVEASDHRQRVVAALDDGPATPTTVAERTDLPLSNVSRALHDLRDHEAVELLVPEDTHKGRIYGLTDTGEHAADRASGVLDA
jgi:DNA-binding transcriptional ArsR family regulator